MSGVAAVLLRVLLLCFYTDVLPLHASYSLATPGPQVRSNPSSPTSILSLLPPLWLLLLVSQERN
jgi:hypothetical protein